LRAMEGSPSHHQRNGRAQDKKQPIERTHFHESLLRSVTAHAAGF
jgi:hypothetical protein